MPDATEIDSGANCSADCRPRGCRRLNPARWLFLLLVLSGLIFLEIPGRRRSFTEYSHGWPLAYLDRDYSHDRTMFDADGLTPEMKARDDCKKSNGRSMVFPGRWNRG
jgi:hypothetical protein